MSLRNRAKAVVAIALRNPAESGFVLVVALIVVVGIVLRSNGYWISPIGLWGDEAHWAARLDQGSTTKLVSRPLGYLWLTRLVVHGFGYDERTVRLLPYLASLGTLLAAPWFARWVFRTRLAAVLMVGLIAFHPVLIDYAKEFKPYSVEVFVHFALMTLFLGYQRYRRAWLLGALAIGAPMAFFFAFNGIFLYPALFALWGIDALRQRRWSGWWPLGLSAAASLAAPLAVYLAVWSAMDSSHAERHWGAKYGAFFIGGDAKAGHDQAATRVDWTVKRYGDVAAMPGLDRIGWKESKPQWMGERDLATARDAWYYLWVAAHGLGIVALSQRRRYDLLALLLAPLGVLLVFNWLGRWPFNDFRVDLFLLAYLIPIATAAFDQAFADDRRWVAWPSRVVVVGVLVLPTLVFGFDWHGDKRYWTTSTNMVAIMDRMHEVREQTLQRNPSAPPEQVLVDAYGCPPSRYYFNHDRKSRRKHGEFFDVHFKLVCAEGRVARRAAAQKQPFWVILNHGTRGNASVARKIAKRAKLVIDETPCAAQRLIFARPSGKDR